MYNNSNVLAVTCTLGLATLAAALPLSTLHAQTSDTAGAAGADSGTLQRGRGHGAALREICRMCPLRSPR